MFSMIRILAMILIAISFLFTCGKDNSTTPESNSPPAAPTNLIGYVLSSSSIRLSWADNSNNETAFLVFRGNSGVWAQIGTTQENQATFTDINLAEVTIYQYYIVATNQVGNSTASDIVSLTTILAAPSNLTGEVLSSSSIRLNWIDNSSFETGFLIFRYSTDIWSQIGIAQQNQTTYTNSNLSDATIYQYYVVARDSIGNSTPSDTLTITTELAAPSNLTGRAISPTSIELHWIDHTQNETGFLVFRCNQDVWAEAGSTGTNQTSFTDTNLVESEIYQYYTVATNDSGNSGPSNTITLETSGILLIGSYDTPNNAEDVFVVGEYAYVADRGSGLQILNVANPANPVFAGSYDTPGCAYDVFVLGEYIYVAAYDSGIMILRFVP